jgi:hypothetical protein
MADINRKWPGVSSLPPNLPFEPRGQVSHSFADPSSYHYSQRETCIHLEDGNLNVHRNVLTVPIYDTAKPRKSILQ